MPSWSIFAILTGLLWSHLPHTINHCWCFRYVMLLYNRMTAQIPSFLVTLWQWVNVKVINVEFSHIYHKIKLERNWFISLQTLANIKHIPCNIIEVEFSPLSINYAVKVYMSLNRPTHHGSILNFIQFHWQICKKISCFLIQLRP